MGAVFAAKDLHASVKCQGQDLPPFCEYSHDWLCQECEPMMRNGEVFTASDRGAENRGLLNEELVLERRVPAPGRKLYLFGDGMDVCLPLKARRGEVGKEVSTRKTRRHRSARVEFLRFPR